MSGDNCDYSATQTLYSTDYAYVTSTAYTNQLVNGSFVETSYLESSLQSQAIPTATLYGSNCDSTTSTSAYSSRNRNKNAESTSTKVVPTSTATYVRASTAADDGGQVILVTSYSTMSATSVFIVYKTESPSITSTSTAVSDATHSSSSHAGPIAGGIVAAVVLIALLAVLAWCLRKRSKRDRDTRALDDFFKDALNPGEAGGAAAGGALASGALSTRKSTMRRKSSFMLDLEKDRDYSHSNDDDNWAALTKLSSGGDEDNNADSNRQRSLSRQSLNAISRGASIRSHGPDDALMTSTGGAVIWDGMTDRPLVEEPDTIEFPPGRTRSNSTLVKSFYEDGRPRSTHRLSSHLSSRSADLLPALSPGLSSQRSISPVDDSAAAFGLLNEDGSGFFTPPASLRSIHRSNHGRINHHLSMSGIYALPMMSPIIPSTSPPPGIPERPKSALGIMALPQGHPQQSVQQPQPSYQRSPHLRGATLQSRASIGGLSQHGSYSHWSPPLSPTRIHPSQRLSRPNSQTQFSSDYPPSRYSHLDIVSREAESGSIAQGETEAGNRQRSLSGSILIKAISSIPERGQPEAVVMDSNPSSTSTSQKTSLNTRNASPEQTSEDELVEGEEEQTAASIPAYPRKSTADRKSSLLISNQQNETAAISEETSRRPSFWQPQAWLAKASA